MRCIKMLVLAVVAALSSVVLAGAGTALAAGALCSSQTNPCSSRWSVGTTFVFSLKSGTTASFSETGGATLDTCSESTIKEKLTSNPGGSGPPTGENTEINWAACIYPTNTLKLGKFDITNIAGGYNGTLFADEEIKFTIKPSIFGDCEYSAGFGTPLGELREGNPATFVANAVLRRTNGCIAPQTAIWTGEYRQTSPNTTFAVSPS